MIFRDSCGLYHAAKRSNSLLFTRKIHALAKNREQQGNTGDNPPRFHQNVVTRARPETGPTNCAGCGRIWQPRVRANDPCERAIAPEIRENVARRVQAETGAGTGWRVANHSNSRHRSIRYQTNLPQRKIVRIGYFWFFPCSPQYRAKIEVREFAPFSATFAKTSLQFIMLRLTGGDGEIRTLGTL